MNRLVAVVFALALGLTRPSQAADINVPENIAHSTNSQQERVDIQNYTRELMSDMVLDTEQSRLGLPITKPFLQLLSDKNQYSVLENCPRPYSGIEIALYSIFTRNLRVLDQPMSSHVNAVLGMAGCSFHEVVELDISYQNTDKGVEIVVTDYSLGVTKN